MSQSTGTKIFFAAMIALIAVGASLSGTVYFLPVDGESVVDLLTPLFLLALFSERVQEVYVEGWRAVDRTPLERELKEAQQGTDEKAIHDAEDKLTDFKLQTRKRAFLVGLAIGIVLATLGIRVLDPLTDIQLAEAEWADTEWGWLQPYLFRGIDIVLTAGLLAGGSDGIHQVIKLFLDFVSMNREKIKVQNPA